MKKMTIALLITFLIVIDVTLYKITKKLHETIDCRVVYKYTDLEGNKGKSSTCYDVDNKLICRDIKNIKIVSDFEKEKECK